MSTFYGNFAALLRAYVYIRMHGSQGLKQISKNAIINANYLLSRLEKILELKYKTRPMHEFVLSAESLVKSYGVKAMDIAKRLLDYGIHAPTVYFPLIVREALMIEPTESFEKEELDRFADAMGKIAEETRVDPELVLKAPQNTATTRLDEAKASHPRTMALSWKMYRKKTAGR